ncbi:GNAT family N-acetyltransferase [Kitasatospora nipponensis]|uniref:GNAT family N-acetyltransferase n=1 Tax=Kitasatospora nipponensis TaxID=258049 RepID=A0ABN1T897_9ACTN
MIDGGQWDGGAGMVERVTAAQVGIEPWSEADLPLLHLTNTPEVMAQLGGPESAAGVEARHRLYLDIAARGAGCRFSVLLLPQREAVGTIGYSERDWQGERVYEMGWKVLPDFQGRGIAAAAAGAAVAHARAVGRLRYLHAFPPLANPASNAVCRRAGFELVGTCDFEYPPGSGTVKRSNDWRLDLSAR